MPYGNMSNSKTFNYNKRFSFSSGLPLDQYKNDLQFAFSIENQLLSSYNGYLIEVEEDGGSTTQEFASVDGTIDRTAIENFCGVNNGYIIGIYDQKSGIKTVISTLAQQIKIVDTGTYQTFTAKYLLEIPQYTLLTVSGIAACNRMKNRSMVDYIAFKGEKVVSCYAADYVFPIKCSAGLMDFKISNGTNVFWYDADGGISTANQPAVTIAAGTSYLFATDLCTNAVDLAIYDQNTDARYIGNTKDLPRLKYKFGISSNNMTGDCAYLPSVYYAQFNGNSVTGVYQVLPTTRYIIAINTAVSADDTDAQIINIYNITEIPNGVLQLRANRTSASDAAVTALTTLGWSLTFI